MTENAQQLATAPAPKSERLIVQEQGATAYLFDTARFEHCYRIATAMARSSLLPEHLAFTGPKNSRTPLAMEQVVANCFLILNQAIRWGVDPFSVPAETYVVANKLGFQGKLIAAVINARGGLKMPLSAIYNSGRGDDMAAVVFGSKEQIPDVAWPLLKQYAKDESGDAYTDLMAMGVRCIRISVGQAKTDNQMWRTDPAQKLYYSGATKWARRHAPEIILGVLTEDDVERMTVEPADVPRVHSIDQLTDRMVGQTAPVAESATSENGKGHTEPAQESAPQETGDSQQASAASSTAGNIDDAAAGFAACDRLEMVGKWEGELHERPLTADEKNAVAGMAEQARERIRQNRPKSGGSKQKELAGA